MNFHMECRCANAFLSTVFVFCSAHASHTFTVICAPEPRKLQELLINTYEIGAGHANLAARLPVDRRRYEKDEREQGKAALDENRHGCQPEIMRCEVDEQKCRQRGQKLCVERRQCGKISVFSVVLAFEGSP